MIFLIKYIIKKLKELTDKLKSMACHTKPWRRFKSPALLRLLTTSLKFRSTNDEGHAPLIKVIYGLPCETLVKHGVPGRS